MDLDSDVFDVNRQYSQREKRVVDRCKHGSERKIKLSDVLVKILRRYCEGFAPDDRLFPFVTENFLWRKRQEWMRAAGLPVIRNHDFRHTVAVAIYRAGMRQGDPDIVPKLSRMLGHKKLAQTYHYLQGLLMDDKPSDAGTLLSWGNIEDDFVVAAAARMTLKESVARPALSQQPAKAVALAGAYPIPIGRPRRRESAPFTLNSPSEGELAADGTQKS